MARPVITIRATRLDKDSVFVQASNALSYFGGLQFTMTVYRSFMNTLITGSAAAGQEGCTISLVENDFEKWN